MIDLVSLIIQFEDKGEYLRFERIQDPLSPRSDLCAFLLLDKLVPGTNDLISDAADSELFQTPEIFLSTDLEALAKVATEDDVLYLVRCGVRWSSDKNSLAMLV